MRRFLMLILAVVLAAVPIPAFAQDATPAASTAVAAPATVYGSDGQPLGTLALANLVDPFNGWYPCSPPTRGSRSAAETRVPARTQPRHRPCWRRSSRER